MPHMPPGPPGMPGMPGMHRPPPPPVQAPPPVMVSKPVDPEQQKRLEELAAQPLEDRAAAVLLDEEERRRREEMLRAGPKTGPITIRKADDRAEKEAAKERKPEQPEWATKEEQVAAFKAMLREKKVTEKMDWTEAMRLIIFDRRYKALATMKEKQEVFESFRHDVVDEERARRVQEERETIERFEALLREVVTDPESRFSKFEDAHSHQPQFKALDSHSQRRRLFDERVRELRAELRRKEEQAQESFRELLNTRAPAPSLAWDKVKPLLEDAPEYKDCPRPARRKLFEDYSAEMLRQEKERLRKLKDRLAQEFRRVLEQAARDLKLTPKSSYSKFMASILEAEAADPESKDAQSETESPAAADPASESPPETNDAAQDAQESAPEAVMEDEVPSEDANGKQEEQEGQPEAASNGTSSVDSNPEEPWAVRVCRELLAWEQSSEATGRTDPLAYMYDAQLGRSIFADYTRELKELLKPARRALERLLDRHKLVVGSADTPASVREKLMALSCGEKLEAMDRWHTDLLLVQFAGSARRAERQRQQEDEEKSQRRGKSGESASVGDKRAAPGEDDLQPAEPSAKRPKLSDIVEEGEIMDDDDA